MPKRRNRAAAARRPLAEDALSGPLADGPPELEGAVAKRGRTVPEAASNAPVSYRLEGGLRHVEPYDHNFTTHVKQRWVGRPLIEVFACEFVAYPEGYYRDAINSGRLTVDGQKVPPEHLLRENECIMHRAARCRENPVLDSGPIRAVAETPELLVVNKPSSLPIHPCGAYRFNSLIALLREQGMVAAGDAVHTTHRLDRLTSGLVLLARTKASAQRVGAWFYKNEIRKTYLARVRGCFADLVARVQMPEADNNEKSDAQKPLPVGVSAAGARVCVRGFIRCVDRKVGKYEFSATKEHEEGEEEPKDATTEFEYVGIASGSNESVVRCFPATGRTHQIRVHLRHLGYPIANDMCYGGELRDDPALPLIPHVYQAGTAGAAAGGAGCSPRPAGEAGSGGASAGGEASSPAAEVVMHPSGIYLHALTYSLPGGIVFSSEAPDWAKCG